LEDRANALQLKKARPSDETKGSPGDMEVEDINLTLKKESVPRDYRKGEKRPGAREEGNERKNHNTVPSSVQAPH